MLQTFFFYLLLLLPPGMASLQMAVRWSSVASPMLNGVLNDADRRVSA
jgi:hypothetical protein